MSEKPVIVATIACGNGYLVASPVLKEHRPWSTEPLEPQYPGAPWGSVTLYAWSDGIVTWKKEREI